MILSLIFLPNSKNVFASSEYFLSCVSCMSVVTAFVLLPVRIPSKSSNALNPDVERFPVRSHQVCKVESHQVCQVSTVCPVANSKFSNHPVFSVIVVLHPKIDITLAFICFNSSGYIVARTYVATPAKTANIANVFIPPLLCFGMVFVGVVMGIGGLMVIGIPIWNVDPATGNCVFVSMFAAGVLGVHKSESKSMLEA